MAYGYDIDPSAYRTSNGQSPNNAFNTVGGAYGPMQQLSAAMLSGSNAGPAAISPEMLSQISYGASNIAGVTQNTGGSVSVSPALAEASDPAAAGNWFTNTFMSRDKDGKATGLNMGNLSSIIQSIGGIYGAMQSVGLAKDQLNFSKDSFNTNMTNQKKSYNTALEDRVSGRYSSASRNEAEEKAYLDRNRL